MPRNEYLPVEVSPPGDTLFEEILERFAAESGIYVCTIKKIFAGEPMITPTIARKLSAVFGTTVAFWVNREGAYREFLKRKKPDANTDK